MKNIKTDYFTFGVEPKYQSDSYLLLGLMGVLNAASGSSQLFIDTLATQGTDAPTFKNCQTFNMTAKVINNEREVLCKFDTTGALSQCYRYLVFKYEDYLASQNDSIFCVKQDAVYLDDF